jgi:hypothetical protein
MPKSEDDFVVVDDEFEVIDDPLAAAHTALEDAKTKTATAERASDDELITAVAAARSAAADTETVLADIPENIKTSRATELLGITEAIGRIHETLKKFATPSISED